MILSIEGLDASGKTTLVNVLDDFKVYREPGGTPKGEEIRSLIKSYPKDSNLFLFLESRRKLCEHLKHETGNIVLDRFSLSTLAYQTDVWYNMSVLYQMDLMARNGVKPDLTIFLNISPEVCAYRIAERKNEPIDPLGLKRLREVYGNYRTAIEFLKIRGWDIVTFEQKGIEEWKADIIELLSNLGQF